MQVHLKSVMGRSAISEETFDELEESLETYPIRRIFFKNLEGYQGVLRTQMLRWIALRSSHKNRNHVSAIQDAFG